MSDKSADRFLQRLESYSRAFARLDELVTTLTGSSSAVLFSNEETGLLTEIISEALIKRFEYTQELSWNLLKDYLIYQGHTDITGSRDAYRKSLNLGLIDSNLWMNMITDRNLSAHDYNDAKSKEVCNRISTLYHPLLKTLLESMRQRAKDIAEYEINEEAAGLPLESDGNSVDHLPDNGEEQTEKTLSDSKPL